MTNIYLIQQLADGYTIPEISNKSNTNIHTLKKKIRELKKQTGCHTLPNLVARYLRGKLIE